eukprot:m.79281 g.79281  ORF g.79281 m.79281 type:complete len:358 (-) comp19284_c0_seq1:25-1098(-)
MATVQPGSSGGDGSAPTVVVPDASPEIQKRLMKLTQEGEQWKGKGRHSRTTNLTVKTSDVQRRESDSLSTPLAARIALMQSDSEKWKTTKRHSQLPTEAVVRDPHQAGGDAGFRRTPGGHVIPAVARPGATRTRTTRAEAPRSKAAASAAPTPAASSPAAAIAQESGNYATLAFPADGAAKPETEDGVVYSRVGSTAKGGETTATYATLRFSGDGAVPEKDESVVYSLVGEASADDSDSDAAERALEANVLYDNDEYTGTAGFGKKKNVKAGAVRRKRVSETQVSTTGSVQPLAKSAPEASEDGVAAAAGTAARGSSSDTDEHEDPKTLYDNAEYTGRHPNLQKKKVFRKKKEEVEC